jgi:hypothetical protein
VFLLDLTWTLYSLAIFLIVYLSMWLISLIRNFLSYVSKINLPLRPADCLLALFLKLSEFFSGLKLDYKFFYVIPKYFRIPENMWCSYSE